MHSSQPSQQGQFTQTKSFPSTHNLTIGLKFHTNELDQHKLEEEEEEKKKKKKKKPDTGSANFQF
jgi:hypothetical protein